MYASCSRGGAVCTTSVTPGTSKPRAATSVATSAWKAPARKAASVASRVACGTSPCSGRAPWGSKLPRAAAKSPHSAFWSQKMMTRWDGSGARARSKSAISAARGAPAPTQWCISR